MLLPGSAALAAPDEPASTCNSYLLADFETGEIIFANKPDERIYPASVTKMLTALVMLEHVPDLSVKVTVGSEINAFGPEASMMDLVEHEQISYLDLLYGMLLVSGNDAAATVAVNVGGSISGFADMMNAKAAELGMINSHFVNPHGMHNENHYTTAADLCKLAAACMHNETFAKVVKTATYTTAPTNKVGNGHYLETTNRLVSTTESNASYRYSGAIGIKTGSTDAAQGCLVAAAQKNGRTLIAVLMGDKSQNYIKRWTDAAKFFDYGFGLTRIDLVPYLAQISTTAALPGSQGTTGLQPNLPATLGYWTDADTAAAIVQSGALAMRIEYNADYTVFAPLSSSPGTAIYTFGDEELCRASLSLVPTAVGDAGNKGSNFWSRIFKILLWMLAFLICLFLLFLVLIIPRLRRKRRRMRKPVQRPPRFVQSDRLPLREDSLPPRQPPAARLADRRTRLPSAQRMPHELRETVLPDNVRVLRTHRRNDTNSHASLYDDEK